SPHPFTPLTAPLFFFNDTAPTEIYTLSLHDALPISVLREGPVAARAVNEPEGEQHESAARQARTRVEFDHRLEHAAEGECHPVRSEEHTSELQSLTNLVCRLLLEKKKKNTRIISSTS